MLKNNLKIAWRNLRRNRLISVLNIGGLALGLATCLVIAQYIRHELSYDRFYASPEQVFRLNTLYKDGAQEERYATTPPPLAETIREEAPGVEAVCRLFHWSDFTMRPDDDFDKVFRETNVYAADADFFRVLDYGLLAGDPVTALKEPASVVLPRGVAVRYFGEAAVTTGNVIGRKLLGGKDAGTPWTVTGLMQDQPANSHLQFDFLISAATYPDDLYRNQNWLWNVMHTYVRLPAAVVEDPARMEAFRKQLDRIARRHVLPQLDTDAAAFASAGNGVDFSLQPLTDIHLTSRYLREMRPNGSLTYVRIFGIVAFFVLLIACVNYINLYTAQAFRRAKEVGVKKVMGAARHQLVRQFLTESFLSGLLAVGLALVLAEGVRALLVSAYGDLPFTESNSIAFVIGSALALWLTVGLLAGGYPAFFLSYFRPGEVLKGKLRTGLKDTGVRNGLVVLQFVLSIGLLFGTFVVDRQLALFQQKKLGFEKENVLVIENDREIEERMEAFKEELSRHPGVISAGFSNGIPGLPSYQMRDFRPADGADSHGLSWYQVDDTHLKTLDMQLLAGRDFDREIAADSFGLILNEAAVARLGLTDPVGKKVIKNEGAEDEEQLHVIGVVKNFHFESLHQPVRPLALQYFKGFVFKDYISVRLAAGDPEAAIRHVKATWDRFEPNVPLRYRFLEKDYDQLYRSEQLLGGIFRFFSALAVLIAGMGLYGLVTYVIEQRMKEIGLRKILGASTPQIVRLLSRDFLRLVLIAFAIAAPLAGWAMHRWLADFAYRADIEWWMFAGAGGLALLIALATVGLRAWSAAGVDPAETLRNE